MIASLARRRSRSESDVRFDKTTVAGLTLQQIDRMSPDEMVCAIQTAVLPSGAGSRLLLKDERTLRRMVYLARRSCRNSGY